MSDSTTGRADDRWRPDDDTPLAEIERFVGFVRQHGHIPSTSVPGLHHCALPRAPGQPLTPETAGAPSARAHPSPRHATAMNPGSASPIVFLLREKWQECARVWDTARHQLADLIP